MEPVAFLQSLLNVNRTGARFLMLGLGVLAAGAVAVGWLGGTENAITLGIYIVGFAVVAAVLSFVVSNRQMKTTLGWMVVALFGVVMAIALDSLLQLSGRVPYPVCLRQILDQPPRVCMASFEDGTEDTEGTEIVRAPVIADNSGTAEDETEPPTTRSVATDLAPEAPGVEAIVVTQASALAEPPRIYMHFAPPVSRDRAAKVARDLVDAGWTLEDGTSGGQQVGKGPTRSQVRYYSQAYHDAARALALDLSAALGGADVAVRDFSGTGLLAADNLIEIWLAP